MTSAWNLDGARVTKKGWKSDDVPTKGGAKAGAKGGASKEESKGSSGLPPMNYTEQ